jgi:hypothetical protein
VKGVSHVKEYQRHVADRADHRVSDGNGASEGKGASCSESELGNGLERQNESGQAPIKDETRIAWEE